MSRVCHFEIYAEDPDRASKFYSGLFGWTFMKWEGPIEYWLITTGPDSEPGINGGLMRRNHVIQGDSVIAYICTVNVTDIDATIAKITELGGIIAVPKMPVPGIGWMAYGKDTEGNLFSVMQMNEQA